jgi:hypothetical protein
MSGCRMSLLTGIKVGLVAVGMLCILAGARLAIPTLIQAGMGSIGLGLIVVGAEAMVTRRIKTGREGGIIAAYGGWAAVFYGIVLLWIGMALIAGAVVFFTGTEQTIVHATIRRPGSALLNLSFLLLAVSGIVLTGFVEARPAAAADRWLRALSVLLQLIPGLILLFLALALLALGLLEIVSPATFDGLGGRFLETLLL